MPRLFRAANKLVPDDSEKFEDYLQRRWPFRDWEKEIRSESVRLHTLPLPPDPWLYLAHRWAVELWDRYEWQWLGDVEDGSHPLHLGPNIYIVRNG